MLACIRNTNRIYFSLPLISPFVVTFNHDRPEWYFCLWKRRTSLEIGVSISLLTEVYAPRAVVYVIVRTQHMNVACLHAVWCLTDNLSQWCVLVLAWCSESAGGAISDVSTCPRRRIHRMYITFYDGIDHLAKSKAGIYDNV